MKRFVVAGLAAMLSVIPAQAAITVTSSSIQSAAAGGLAASFTTGPGSVLFTFDNGVIAGPVNGFGLSNNNGFLSSNVAAVAGNDILGTFSAPTGDGSVYLKIGAGGTETIANTANSFNTLSLYWGSPDDYNSITFLDQAGAALGSITAASIAGLDTLGQSALVTVSFNQAFYGVTLASGTNAFELDNVKLSTAASVPEPASWAMMIAGFGAVGFALRRRHEHQRNHVLG